MWTIRFSIPVLASLLAFSQVVAAERCVEDTLVGSWHTTWSEEIWTFKADGELKCMGLCDYGAGVGEPRAWAYEPEGNLFSRPIDHVKLIFTEHRFEGVSGAYRCTTTKEGRHLVLEPFRGDTLHLDRVR